MNLAFDLFADDPEPAAIAADSNVQNLSPVSEAESVCPSEPDDHHVLAFVAVCRAAGIDHPALTPVDVGTILLGGKRLVGRRAFDRAQLASLANHILRGLASDRPRVTPERWREAAEAAPQWLTCERIAAAQGRAA
jgi:hypothetical protein